MQLSWAITLQIFWAKSSNPRVGVRKGEGGGTGGERDEPERSRVTSVYFVLNHGPPLVYELSFTGTVRSQHLQEHSSGLRTSQSGQWVACLLYIKTGYNVFF